MDARHDCRMRLHTVKQIGATNEKKRPGWCANARETARVAMPPPPTRADNRPPPPPSRLHHGDVGDLAALLRPRRRVPAVPVHLLVPHGHVGPRDAHPVEDEEPVVHHVEPDLRADVPTPVARHGGGEQGRTTQQEVGQSAAPRCDETLQRQQSSPAASIAGSLNASSTGPEKLLLSERRLPAAQADAHAYLTPGSGRWSSPRMGTMKLWMP